MLLPVGSSGRLAIGIVKIVVLSLVIWSVWPYIVAQAFTDAILSTSALAAIAVSLLFLAQACIATARWRWIISQMGHEIPYWSVLRVWMISQFVSQILPAIIGGDAARVVALKQHDVPLSTGSASILVDRISGFLALVALSILSLPALYLRVSNFEVPIEFWYTIGIGSLLGVAGLLGLRWVIRSSIGDRSSAISRIKASLRQVSYTPVRVIFLAVTGFGTVFTLILSAWIFGAGADARIDFLACFAVLPIITLLTFVPISVAGWGVREALMVGGLGLLGVPGPAALAVSVKLGIANVALGLLGGIVWLVSRGVENKAKSDGLEFKAGSD
jgi:glycosyltransferase 2 family protein